MYIGKRILKHFGFLYKLFITKSPKVRYRMVQDASRDQLLAIVEVCANISRKNFKLTRRFERVLQRYDSLLHKAGRTKTPTSFLKVVQEGEGLIVDPKAARKRDRFKIRKRQYGYGFLPAVVVPVLYELAKHYGPKIYEYLSK